MNEKAVIVAIFMFVALFAIALNYSLSPIECSGYDCFQAHMIECSRAIYVNVDPEASWLYQIQEKTAQGCNIEVTLLQAKEGELNLRDLETESMICTYPFGVAAYPDKDMSLCTGKLKESLQNIIIGKLHKYIINNLADLKEALNQNSNSSL
jgi:hypothetical protein